MNRPIYINRVLRENGLLNVRIERDLELFDGGASPAFAVADHQIAHIYFNDPGIETKVRGMVEKIPGVELVLNRAEQKKYHIGHERTGDLVLVADQKSWFCYYFWLDDAKAPDYARAVDIHKKPGYDPVEMFMTSKARAGYKLLRKMAGFRYVMDVIPLDATLIKGSHGCVTTPPDFHPVIITDNELPAQNISAVDVHDVIWQHLNGG